MPLRKIRKTKAKPDPPPVRFNARLIKFFMRLLKDVAFALWGQADCPRITALGPYVYACNGHFLFRQCVSAEPLLPGNEGAVVQATDLKLWQERVNNIGATPEPLAFPYRKLDEVIKSLDEAKQKPLYDVQQGLNMVEKNRGNEQFLSFHLDPLYLKIAAGLALEYQWEAISVELCATDQEKQAVFFRRVYSSEQEKELSARSLLPDVFVLMPRRRH